MMFILVARLSLTYCTTSVAIVCKLLHVRYNDDWKKVCRCWFEFIVHFMGYLAVVMFAPQKDVIPFLNY